jgi:glycosyl transferase, family 25
VGQIAVFGNVRASALALPPVAWHGAAVLFDRFDIIRIINLAYRTDRRAEMTAELRRVGLEGDPRVAFFEACTFPDAGRFSSKGARGVYHSHLAILQEAARSGQSVLILEDDTDFREGTQDYDLPEPWSIFYGGYYATTSDNLHESDIVGGHMMGFHADIVGHVAEYLANIRNDDIHPPIDGAYVWYRRAHPEVPTHFARPPLGNQRPSRTDIADLRFFDRLPILRQAASLTRKVRRQFQRATGRGAGG